LNERPITINLVDAGIIGRGGAYEQICIAQRW
jgi:hypothetical protein